MTIHPKRSDFPSFQTEAQIVTGSIKRERFDEVVLVLRKVWDFFEDESAIQALLDACIDLQPALEPQLKQCFATALVSVQGGRG